MKNEEKAQEISKKHARIRLVPCYGLKGEFERYEEASSELDCLHAAREMAKWKDNRFAEMKKQLIDKACEWLKDMAIYYCYWEFNGDTYEKEIVCDTEKLINDFKQEIEK